MPEKKILIIDEDGFSRICSALLESVGYKAEIVTDLDTLLPQLNSNDFALIVASYPYGAFVFNEIKRKSIPTIIISGDIDQNLISILNDFDNSYCMIKPLDYEKFSCLIKEVVDGDSNMMGGYSIV